MNGLRKTIVGGAVSAEIANRLPYGRLRMVYSPSFAARTNRPMTVTQYQSIVAQHRSHVHVSVDPPEN